MQIESFKKTISTFLPKVLLYFFFSFLILLRKPDTITNPQFWAEDGTMWYATAYNQGVSSLVKPQAGYFQTYSRLTALVAQLFPVSTGPLIFTLSAVLAQTLPVYLITTKRIKKTIPSSVCRFILILLFLLLPNVGEAYLNVTNAMWYLSIALFIILVTRPDDPSVHKLDFLFILFAGLSGPFSIFLTVVFICTGIVQKKKKIPQHILLLILTAMIQVTGLLLSKAGGRVFFPTGISFVMLEQIVVKQIVWGALAGKIGQAAITKYFSSFSWTILQMTTYYAICLVCFCLLKGPLVLKQFILFALLIFISTLCMPTAQTPTPGVTNWQLFSQAYDVRYWLIPMLAFLISIVWAATSQNPLFIRISGYAFLAIFFIFCLKNYRQYHNFRYGPLEDLHYSRYSEIFETSQRGTVFSIPINPHGWVMTLTKK